MPTLNIQIDEETLMQLRNLSSESHRDSLELVAEAIRRYLGDQARLRSLQQSTLRSLYEELEAEDLALAEAGIGEYSAGLYGTDQGVL